MSDLTQRTDGVLFEAPSVQSLHFETVVRRFMVAPKPTDAEGIGVYSEKRVHAIIKHFLCDDESCHEVKILPGKKGQKGIVADVFTDGMAYEVQTGSFYPLVRKIEAYLRKTEIPVTVIYPIAAEKWINWMDPETGAILKRTRSTKKGRVSDVMKEIYWFRDFLPESRLTVCVFLLDVEEFRFRDGWDKSRTRGATKYDRIPTVLKQIVRLRDPEDYARFLPPELPSEFKASDYARLSGIRGVATYGSLQVLCKLGLIEPSEIRGRAQWYKKRTGTLL